MLLTAVGLPGLGATPGLVLTSNGPSTAPSWEPGLPSGGTAGYVLTSTGPTTAPTWQAASGVTWPLTYSGDEAFQPDGIANNVLTLHNPAGAVNGITISGATTGHPSLISPSGTDANIGIVIQAKGTGVGIGVYAADNTGAVGIGAPNYPVSIGYGATSGTYGQIISLIAYSELYAPNFFILDDTGGETHFTSKINADVSTLAIVYGPTTGLHSGLLITGYAAGTAPSLSVASDNANENLALIPKGTGLITLCGQLANYLTASGATTGNPPTIAAVGSDTNVGLNLVTQGTGVVTVNGSPIGGVSWPLTYSGDEAFQPNSVANNALDLHNNAGAANGIAIIAGAAASLDLAAAGTLTIGPTNATGVTITPPTTITGALTATGGVTTGAGKGLLVPAGQGLDTAAAGALDIGAATATSVTIKPATTITGGLSSTRITKRVLPTAGPGATPSIDTDTYDVAHFTALAAAITSMTTNLTGTPVDGDTLRISFTDNGTPRAIAWGTSFEASTVALPVTTVISTRLDVGFLWNTETSKWRCVAVA